MLVNNRGIFSKAVTSFDDKTTDQLDQFLQHSVLIVKQSIKDAKKHRKLFKRLPHYFPKPKPPPEPDPKDK